jgi:hypothetical protein
VTQVPEPIRQADLRSREAVRRWLHGAGPPGDGFTVVHAGKSGGKPGKGKGGKGGKGGGGSRGGKGPRAPTGT